MYSDEEEEHSSNAGELLDQSATPPLTYSEHSSSEKDEPSTPFLTSSTPPSDLLPSPADDDDDPTTHQDHFQQPITHHHHHHQSSFKSSTTNTTTHLLTTPSPSADSLPPFSGVGWRIGTKQTDPNIFKHSNSLSSHPPRSKQLLNQSPARSFDLDPDFVPFPDDPHCLRHAEFGYDPNEHDFMWVSRFTPSTNTKKQEISAEDAGYFTYLTTYWSYLLVFLIGHVRDAFGKTFSGQSHAHLKLHNGYAALNSDFDSFFTRRVKSRLDDCFGRPVSGTPARTITLLDRTSSDNCVSFKYTQTTTQALNISSYNYLGFAQSQGSCSDAVQTTISELGVSSSGSRDDVGSSPLLIETEKLLAQFVGAEDAMLVSQGFATNSTTLPALVGKGALVISDEYNHNSIRFGTRLSGAMVRTYKHNDMRDLERLLREAISQGQPRRLRAWSKILVVVEGIYSMEGSIVDLPNILRLKDKYKFYLYLDEAHSIGALGPNGRGTCDYYGIDPSRVDLLMGTLTKSFGASGGYIAGSKAVIAHMRKTCHSSIYAESVSPPVISQILSAVKSIMVPESPALPGLSLDKRAPMPEGKRRLRRLAFNARYLRAGLRKLGFIVIGDHDSPVVPLLVYQPGKMLLFSRLMLQRYSIVVVIVGYPATPLVSGRVRFCVSAAHTKQDIDQILIATDEIGEALGMKLNRKIAIEQGWTVQKVIRNAKDLVLLSH
ncbi:serine palmitoyltransferase component [Puccinia graminis f. sp. tritici]|uniref:serine C-palmitoyltransferase n=1 Tax=Puccinia graminis f. sp. tritici TaxID=56615 RepID=A0A5B0RQ13_PUCGR|nr:serine palmitoyltransferase component [Puccinia graminis f. sp. tritici]